METVWASTALLQVVSGERWSWGHISPGRREETLITGILPLGTCLQCGKARAQAAHARHHRVQFPKAMLFPRAPLEFSMEGDKDEPPLIRGKPPFLWDYSLPLKLGTKLSPIESARHRTSAQHSLPWDATSPSPCLGASTHPGHGAGTSQRGFSHPLRPDSGVSHAFCTQGTSSKLVWGGQCSVSITASSACGCSL